MAKFVEVPQIVDAQVWNMLSPHPDVQQSTTSLFVEEQQCLECHCTFMRHGWIGDDNEGQLVCPESWIVVDAEGAKAYRPDVFHKLFAPVQ